MREAVPVKYFPISGAPRPTASKICAPKKLRSVEMPIRLKVFSSPFFTAVM
jgi:hypothetical protein